MALHKYMARDDGLKLFDAKASGWFTQAAHASTYSVDLGAADVDMKDPGVIIAILSGMTSAGSATVALIIHDSADDSTFAVTTPVTVGVTAIAFDNALWADAIYLPIPDFGIRRYIKLIATVAGANLTAGTIDAWYSKRAQ